MNNSLWFIGHKAICSEDERSLIRSPSSPELLVSRAQIAAKAAEEELEQMGPCSLKMLWLPGPGGVT